MKKYLVNYRVDISATSTIPYLEYTAIYEVESMMTQEDVEAFEEAKTEEHGGRIATMVSFCELKHSTSTLEDYIEALPYLTFKNCKLETTDNCGAYIPTLYKFEGKWVIDWIDAEEDDSIKVIKGTTPFEAAKNAYNWCIEEGYINNN